MMNPMLKSILGFILLSLASSYLVGRAVIVFLMFKNAPARLEEFRVNADFEVKFADQFRNCEDALMVEEDGVAILSCDAGRDRWNTVMGTFPEDPSQVPSGELIIYHYTSQKESINRVTFLDYPAANNFHPLGVEYHRPSNTLFVCNHHPNGSRLDVFSMDLSKSEATATYRSTIADPVLKGPNSVVAISDHELYVSNDHYFLKRYNPWLSTIETYAGIPGGAVAYVNVKSGTVRPVAHVPFANGVVQLNETVLAVASTSTARVYLYQIQPDRSLRRVDSVKLPFLPDNLSIDKRGTLLIAGHPHPPSLEKVAKSRPRCQADAADCPNVHAPSWVAEWKPDGSYRNIFVSKSDFITSSTAIRDADRKLGIVTGLYEKGILVWREENPL
ncbi:hypothetical protein BDV25DRAFT_148836 [Aspergillus avenaceus]|uniref:Calcium-dependent phosphotriesterase n=1 Tax=Aspergillus avenaceus TaxID=36643 RepID=A0A5N6U5G8_ASPAV|nr:hypothetical protein BDV25DRAFT_148836 [Aspergillus avenaceus]